MPWWTFWDGKTGVVTRRTVLQTAALSIIGSALPAPVIAKNMPAPVKVVFENGITESIAFKDALKFRASAIHILKQDPAETFRELSGPWDADTTILGCTKGAAAFVLIELARGQGGKMLMFGEHRYLPGDKVEHSLLLQDASTQMINLTNNWSREMAAAIDAELCRATPVKKQVITLDMNRPATSPDYLVTWGMFL